MNGNSLIKKGLVVGIILLFVGSSGVSSIIDYDKDETLNTKNNDYNNLIKQAIASGIISNDGWTEQDKLLSSDGAEADYLGHSVSIDDDYAIVGAYGDSDNGYYSGSAYVFTRSGNVWTEQAKLIASDGAHADSFGYSQSKSRD